MRSVLVCFEFFHLQVNVAVDLVFCEHVACQQVLVICFKLVQSFTQRATYCRDTCQLFRGKIVQVFVHGFARIDFVLDAVEAGHQQSCEAEVGVRGRIRETCLDALCFRGFCPRNTYTTRTVTCRVGAQNGCFEARDQTLVRVCRRVGEGVQRFRVLQDTTDEVQSFLRQVCVFVASKERLAVFPDRHVAVHACAVVAVDRLRHEGCGFAVRVCHVVDDVLVLLQVVGLLGQRAKDHAQLVLTGRHFVVVLVNFHADALHCGQHLVTDVLSSVCRVDREVTAFDTRAVAHVAHFEVGVCVPSCVDCVNFEGHFVHRVRILDVVEQEEFSFRTPVGYVTDARGLQVRFRFLRCAARVTVVCFACVGLNNGAVQTDCLFCVERVDVDRVCVGHQFHVGSFDRLPACDGGTIEHETFFQEVCVNLVCHYCYVLKLATRIGEADVDILDALVFDHLENCVLAHSLSPFLSSGSGVLLDLKRVGTGFTGTDADRLFNRRYKNFAVTDFVGFSCVDDSVDRAVNLIVVQNDFDLHLGKEVDDVFSTTIKLCMAFLTSKAFDLDNRETLNACILQSFFNFVQFERLDDRFDLFHALPPSDVFETLRPRCFTGYNERMTKIAAIHEVISASGLKNSQCDQKIGKSESRENGKK